MKYFIRKQDSLPDYLERICLDSPSLDNCAYEGERFYISGWILARKPGVQIFLENSMGDDFEISLNKLRPDVLRKIKKIDISAIDDENSRIGFNHEFLLRGNFSIVIKYKEHKFVWINGTASLSQDIIDFWQRARSNRKLDVRLRDQIYKNINKHQGFSKEVVARTFGIEYWDSCKKFEGKFNNFSNYVDLLNKIEEGKFPFIIESSNSRVVSNFLHAGYNYIFVCNGDVEYFHIQHVSSADAIFFPATNDLVFLSDYIDASAIFHLLNIANDKFYINKGLIEKPIGYAFGFSRPYHFLYDQYPVVNFLLEYGIIERKKCFFVRESHNFLSLKNSYSLDNLCVYDNDELINGIIESKKSYVFKLGFSFQHGAINAEKIISIGSGDKNLLKIASSNYDSEKGLESFRNCDFKLWVGITGQKRSWLEQVEGSIKIINYIAEKYENPCIVIDGWTSVLHESMTDSLEIENDMKIFRKISEGVRSNVQILNLIGESILKKIYVASHVDFFVSNALTGSINVARICAKPGVAHYSKVTLPIVMKHHIHPRTFLPSTNIIEDVPDANNSRVDFCSYSIDPDAFLEFFKTSLKSAQANDFSLATSYRDILN